MRCVIIGAAEISDYNFIKSYFKNDDFFIFCDGGLNHAENLGIKADLIIGDFDSHLKPETNVETITLPCEKDDTDTYYAVKEAINRGFEEFLLIGVVGGRFDHSLGNIAILKYLFDLGKFGIIVDDYSEMQIIGNECAYIDGSFSYFSLLNIYGKAKGIDVINAKYPLKNAEITTEYQYGISNEVVSGKTASVSVKNGNLLLIKVK